MGRKIERCCKIKIIILAFEFLGFGLDVFLSLGVFEFLICGLMFLSLGVCGFFNLWVDVFVSLLVCELMGWRIRELLCLRVFIIH